MRCHCVGAFEDASGRPFMAQTVPDSELPYPTDLRPSTFWTTDILAARGPQTPDPM